MITLGCLGYALIFDQEDSDEFGDRPRFEELKKGGDRGDEGGDRGNDERDRDDDGDRDDEDGWEDVFESIGTYALIAGAIAFSWFAMKRTITSKFQPLKKLAKWTFKVHYFIGWVAVITTAIHATYFLWTDFNGEHTWDGIASLLPLLALAVYGWIMIKSRQKLLLRRIHVSLAILWLVALAVHAGGEFIQITVITVLVWSLIWIWNAVMKKGSSL